MPALAIGLRTDEQIAEWIAVRIAEAISGTVPSIAILVDAEERVLPLSRAMNDALSHTNITSVPCQGGLSVGQDNQVRVFDVRHIKGLEFEAVFFVGLDRLARDEPDLLAKYLYVGATRAALFLGLTVEEQMPQAIRGLEALCVSSWKQKPH
jgi:superfamily I DNA/RNA helicase